MDLINFMAQACHYAQECTDEWSGGDKWDRTMALECTSHQMACFLAQNTVMGNFGVESGIFIDQLVEIPMKSIDEWEKLIKEEVKSMGGLKLDIDKNS